MTILILGNNEDAQVNSIMSELARRKKDCILFDTATFPTLATLSWDPLNSSGQLCLADGVCIDFADIKAVYWRNFNDVGLPPGLDNEQAFIAHRDCMSTLRTFFNSTDAIWANGWDAYEFHKEKPRQLALAKSIGTVIPKTLVSNCASRVIAFYKTLEKAIYKPVYGGAHTEFLTDELVDEKRLQTVLTASPVTIQEFIPGTNIRTYVIGDETFSAEIRSSSVDFREDYNSSLIPIDLPEEIKSQSLKIKDAFSMSWTAIDWRRTDDGEYYFLEANPSPMFDYFEQVTGLPIAKSLCDLLARG